MAFNRKTELYIGIFKDAAQSSDSGYLVDGLHYEFDVTRSTEFYKDSATFTIYNPNSDTIHEIMTSGCAVIFKAGYEDEGMGTIFVGQIASAYPEDDGPENTKLILICNSQRGAQYQLQRVYMTALVEEGKTYYDVLKIIANYVGIPLSGAETLKSQVLDAGYILSGPVRDVVMNFTAAKLRPLGGKVIISNNEMVYLGPADSITLETAYLTYKTGLISAKTMRDEKYQSTEDAFNENKEYYLGLAAMGDKEVAAEKAKQANVPSRNEVEFECLMNPGISIGGPIYIDARRNDSDLLSVVGKFFVTDLHYQGDNFGGNYNLSGRAYERTDL